MATIRPWKRGWQVRWKEKVGTEWRDRSRSCSTLRAARSLRREVEHAVAVQGLWRPEEPSKPAGVREEPGLEELIAVFLTAQKAGGKADNTILRYGQALEVFVRWARRAFRGQRLTGDLLSESTMTRFYVWLGKGTGRHGKRRSATTRRKYLQIVLNWWSWLTSKDEWKAYVTASVPALRHLDVAPALRKRTLAPTWVEMDSCIACANGSQRQLYTVLRFTGLRVQQAMELRWDDLDLDDAILHVRPELGKTQQEKMGRWVPVSEHLVEVVSGWGRREGYLVPSRRGLGAGHRSPRLARSRDARRAWDRAIEQYDVRPAVARLPHHSFRAGFVTGLKRLGADDEAVENLVGHSLGLRGLYTDPDALPMKEAVSLIPPLSEPTRISRPIDLATRAKTS